MISKLILTVFAAVLASLLIFAATKPDSFRVQRSILIQAPPEKIQPLIDNLHSFGLWSPYEGRDPAMKRTYSGPESGVGAHYAWEGDKNVGAGSMEVLTTSPAQVTMKLEFLKPFEAHNTAEFSLTPKDGGTEVTWAMYGPSPYVSKVMDVIFNLDKMIGGDFATGLAKLKKVAEQ